LAGGYLRTSWRSTQSGLKGNILGAPLSRGSAVGGIGANFPNGGFVMGSINGSTGDVGGSTMFSAQAISVMNLFYGSDGVGLPLIGRASGYKIMPMNAWLVGSYALSGSAGLVWASITTSDDSVIHFYVGGSTVSVGTSANVQAHIVWNGFIVSGP